MRIIRKISFAIASSLFSIIPSIYDMFEKFASAKFFTNETIKTISNNIYILISVCMLFMFGIRLISAIVNPELFDDKKKGVGKTFINSILAVVLITVTPIGFDYMYKVQDSMLSSHFIEKIVFGMDPDSMFKDGRNAGNLLAAYTFRAFCYPNTENDHKISATSIVKHYNEAVQGNMDAIEEFGEDINSKTDGEWDFKYHVLLSPLAAGYVAYELILMTIDIAFRSIKLGLLQFIAPLVICAFVFSGTELLSKWFKEIVSTFVLVFVKIAAIVFIIFGMSQFDSILSAVGAESIWGKGLVYVITLIALLQLIKKLPDLINKIFGTDIKSQGGIGDRLGEMAGVGAVAKKAWDKVKTTTGRAAALGGGILATGPLGVGAAVGAGYAGKRFMDRWNKGKKDADGNYVGEAWKNTKAGRGIRMFGAGAKAVGKGLTSGGGVIKGVQEGIKAYDETAIGKETHITAKGLEAKKRADDKLGLLRKEAEIGPDGKVTDKGKADQLSSKTTAMELYRNAAKAEDALTDDKKAIVEGAVQARGKVAAIEKIASSRDALRGIAGSLAGSLEMSTDKKDLEVAAKLRSLEAGLDSEKGNVNLHNVEDQLLKALGGLNPEKRDQVVTKELKAQIAGHQDQMSNYMKFTELNYTEKDKNGNIIAVETSDWDSAKLKGKSTSFSIEKDDKEAELKIVKDNASADSKAAIEDLENIGQGLTKQSPDFHGSKRPPEAPAPAAPSGSSPEAPAPAAPSGSSPASTPGTPVTPGTPATPGATDSASTGSTDGDTRSGDGDRPIIVNPEVKVTPNVNVTVDSKDLATEVGKLSSDIRSVGNQVDNASTNIVSAINQASNRAKNQSDAAIDATKKIVDSVDDLNKPKDGE